MSCKKAAIYLMSYNVNSKSVWNELRSYASPFRQRSAVVLSPMKKRLLVNHQIFHCCWQILPWFPRNPGRTHRRCSVMEGWMSCPFCEQYADPTPPGKISWNYPVYMTWKDWYMLAFLFTLLTEEPIFSTFWFKFFLRLSYGINRQGKRLDKYLLR